MGQNAHTPGPWRVEMTIYEHCACEIVGKRGIAPVWSGPNAWADATLIAAAPTMKADIDEFMRRLGPRWFLEQGWFPASLAPEPEPDPIIRDESSMLD